jgi:plasmid stabilization system protein ParE
VKLFTQPSAEDDIVRQFEWYVEHGLPAIAVRFRAAAASSIDALLLNPHAGAPKRVRNPKLTDLQLLAGKVV